mgnify:CR=1 FL=1
MNLINIRATDETGRDLWEQKALELTYDGPIPPWAVADQALVEALKREADERRAMWEQSELKAAE